MSHRQTVATAEPMNATAARQVGRSGLRVPRLGLGTGPLGGARVRVGDAAADALVAAALAEGLHYIDTAPWYGVGQAELHLGRTLRAAPRDGLVLSTKVGRLLVPASDADQPPYATRWPGGAANDVIFDYTRAGVLRSHEDSLRRLGVDRVDALVVHDLDYKFHASEDDFERRFAELDRGGGFAALAELKRAGRIRAIGVGINQVGLLARFVDHFDVDFFLLAMPYTLLDQPALDAELPLCVARGISVVVGAPYCSGLLAAGAVAGAWYGYKPADAPVLDRMRRIEAVCQRHGVALAAAALQFPLAHPAVVSVIPGPESAEQVRSNIAMLHQPIPVDCWAELKALRLLREDAPTP